MAGNGESRQGIVVLVCLFLLLFWPDKKQNGKAGLIGIVGLVFFAGGFFRTTWEDGMHAAYAPILESSEQVQIQGKIYKKEIRNDRSVIYLNHVILQADGSCWATGPVPVYLTGQSYPIGKTIVLKGNIETFRSAVNEGGYDEKQYYHTLNMDYRFYAQKVCRIEGNTNWLAEGLYELREKLAKNYEIIFDRPDDGIMSAMLLGDKNRMDEQLYEDFRKAGVAHILVISGMHISIIGLGIYRLLSKRLSFGIAAVMALLIICLYIDMTGMGLSAIRAGIMLAFLLMGKVIGRTYDSVTALSATLLILLWENPYRLEHVGLQFTVAAVIGAVVVAGRILTLREWRRFGKAVIFSASIQCMTLPLVARYYYEIPLYAVVVNLVVVPLLGVVMASGILCSCLGAFSITLARIAAFPVGIIFGMIRRVVALGLSLPGATQVVGHFSVWRVALCYGVICIFLMLFTKGLQKSGCNSRKYRISTAFTVIVFVALFCMPRRFIKSVSFLDVGQGDGIYLRTQAGSHLFVDGGSSDVTQVGTYRILPFLKFNGVRGIDYWFVSHYDADHVSGLLEVLKTDYPIRHLVLPGKREGNEQYETMIKLAKEKQIPVLYLKQGDVLQFHRERMLCLWPKAGENSEDENANSLVLFYEGSDFHAVFTGDAGKEQEAAMIADWTDGRIAPSVSDDKALILKAGHHGAKTATGEDWLTFLKPDYTVISCARKNSYGHPADETVQRILNSESLIFYTMEGGQIDIICKKGEVRMQTFLER